MRISWVFTYWRWLNVFIRYDDWYTRGISAASANIVQYTAPKLVSVHPKKFKTHGKRETSHKSITAWRTSNLFDSQTLSWTFPMPVVRQDRSFFLVSPVGSPKYHCPKRLIKTLSLSQRSNSRVGRITNNFPSKYASMIRACWRPMKEKRRTYMFAISFCFTCLSWQSVCRAEQLTGTVMCPNKRRHLACARMMRRASIISPRRSRPSLPSRSL